MQEETNYSNDLQQEFISIIEKATLNNSTYRTFSNREAIMLFYWMRNKDKPQFNFVMEHFNNKTISTKKRYNSKKSINKKSSVVKYKEDK